MKVLGAASQSKWWIGIWILWLIILTILSSMSKPGLAIPIVGIDKVQHAVMFAAGGCALAMGLALHRFTLAEAPNGAGWWRIGMIVLIVSALIGWLDEWHQSFIPQRFGLDFYDWVADIVGSVLAVPCARFLLRRLARAMKTDCVVSARE